MFKFINQVIKAIPWLIVRAFGGSWKWDNTAHAGPLPERVFEIGIQPRVGFTPRQMEKELRKILGKEMKGTVSFITNKFHIYGLHELAYEWKERYDFERDKAERYQLERATPYALMLACSNGIGTGHRKGIYVSDKKVIEKFDKSKVYVLRDHCEVTEAVNLGWKKAHNPPEDNHSINTIGDLISQQLDECG